MKYFFLFLSLLFISSCDEMCIDAYDAKQTVERTQISVSAESSEYVTHPLIKDDADIEIKGEILMNCPREEYELLICQGAGCTVPGITNVIIDDTWLDTGINLSASVLIITEVSGDWSVRSTQPGNACLLVDKKEGIACSSKVTDSVRVRITDTLTSELSSFAAPESTDDSGNKRYILSPVQNAGFGTNLLLKLAHYDTDNNIIFADPRSPDYTYEGKIKIGYYQCDMVANSKVDGDCIDPDLKREGRFLIADYPGDRCGGDTDRVNNFGSYTIYYSKQTNSVLGDVDIFSGMIISLKELLLGDGTTTSGITGEIYKAIVTNVPFLAFVYSILALSIIFFSYGYIIGSSNLTSKAFIIYVIKVATILFLLSEPGWDFLRSYIVVFIVDIVPAILEFYVDAMEYFLLGVTYPDVTATNPDNYLDYSDYTRTSYPLSGDWEDVFTYYNLIVNALFSKNFWIKAHAIIFSFPSDFFGIIVGIIIFLAMLFAILKVTLVSISYAVMSVAISITTTSLVLILTPTVILFWLFERTKSSFLTVLIPYLYFSFLNPLLVIMGGAVVVGMAYLSLENILSFMACSTCVVEISIGIAKFRIEFCLVHAYAAFGTGVEYPLDTVIHNFPISFFQFTFLIISFRLLEVASVVMTSYALEISSVRQYSNPQNYLQQGVIGAASGQVAMASEIGSRLWAAGKRMRNRSATTKR